MKFKNKDIQIGDVIIVTETCDEFGDKLKNEKRHVGFVNNVGAHNKEKFINITHKDAKNYKDKIESFKDFFTKSLRIIYEKNYGIFSDKVFFENKGLKIKKVK